MLGLGAPVGLDAQLVERLGASGRPSGTKSGPAAAGPAAARKRHGDRRARWGAQCRGKFAAAELKSKAHARILLDRQAGRGKRFDPGGSSEEFPPRPQRRQDPHSRRGETPRLEAGGAGQNEATAACGRRTDSRASRAEPASARAIPSCSQECSGFSLHHDAIFQHHRGRAGTGASPRPRSASPVPSAVSRQVRSRRWR